MGKVRLTEDQLGCDDCLTEVEANHKFCHQCGKSLSMICPHCHKGMLVDSNKLVVCNQCERELDSKRELVEAFTGIELVKADPSQCAQSEYYL